MWVCIWLWKVRGEWWFTNDRKVRVTFTLLFPSPSWAQGRKEEAAAPNSLLTCPTADTLGSEAKQGLQRQRGYKIKKGGLLGHAREANPGTTFLESNVATQVSGVLKTCVPSDPVISLPTIYPEQKVRSASKTSHVQKWVHRELESEKLGRIFNYENSFKKW